MSHRQVPDSDVEVGLRAPFGALLRKLPYLIVFGGMVAAGAYLLIDRIEPLYKAGATVLIVPGESDPGDGGAGDAIDSEVVSSQLQLVRSRDLAKTVAGKLDLVSYPDFDPHRPRSWPGELLTLIGFDAPAGESSDEERVLTAYYDRLSVHAVANSRVIAVDFSAEDQALAALAANTIAEEYIALLHAARHDSTTDAVRSLSVEIDELRARVEEAEAGVTRHRADHRLATVAGAEPSPPSPQQLSDVDAELTKARGARAEAERRAAEIGNALATGDAATLADVVNAPPLERLVTRQAALRAEGARLGATLLPEHPRLRELATQVIDLDRQIAGEARIALQSAEAEARLAVERDTEIGRRLSAMKTVANAAAELGALEATAAAQRELLESSLGRYREALAREEAVYLPADARIVSRAAVPLEPDFPKKLPMTITVAVAAFLLATALLLLRELSRGRTVRRVAFVEPPTPAIPGMQQADVKARWSDDRSVRRMMPKEPTLVPEMTNQVEQTLATITNDIIRSGKKRVLVTLAEGSDANGRPLGAVALARALARTDSRVVLVDFRADGADAASMGEAGNVPGFSDLFDGEASFAQVIFRDRRSRVHFIPTGREPLAPVLIDPEQMETVLSALTLTYDYVLLDTGDNMIAVVGPSCGVAAVVSEHDEDDPRTIAAFERVKAASEAIVLLLVVDPSTEESDGGAARATAEAAA